MGNSSLTAKALNDQYHDYRAQYIPVELLKMQKFHFQQAQIKLSNNQVAYAWGDLAYILCHIPNHHEALKQIQELAAQLNRQEEMLKFYDKALRVFPNDKIVLALYNKYLPSSP